MGSYMLREAAGKLREWAQILDNQAVIWQREHDDPVPSSAAEAPASSPPVMGPTDWIYWLNRIAPLEEAVARLEARPQSGLDAVMCPGCKLVFRLSQRPTTEAGPPGETVLTTTEDG